MHRKLNTSETPAALVQAQAAVVLYQRLVSPGGPVNYLEIAEHLGVVPATVHRQLSGDIPVQLRTVVAMLQLDPEGGRALLDLLGQASGIRWTDATPEDTSHADVLSEAWAAVGDAAELQRSIAHGARDGRFDCGEREDLRQKLAAIEHRGKQFRAKLDALENTGKKVERLGRRA